MGKHDSKVQKLQADVIENRNDGLAAIEVRKGLKGSDWFDNSDPLAFIQRADLDGAFVQIAKTRLVTVGDFSIDWQVDTPPGEINTYAQKHGNAIGNVLGFFTDSGVKTKYEVGVSFTEDGTGKILQVNFTTVFPGIIIII